MKSQLSRPVRISLALFAAAFAASSMLAGEAISLTGPTTYVQNFDGLGTATNLWTDDGTIPGWFAGINANNTPDGNLQATDGADAAPLSGLLNLGSAGSAERALGSKATSGSNFANIAFGVVFQNNSAQPLVITNIAYRRALADQYDSGRSSRTVVRLLQDFFDTD